MTEKYTLVLLPGLDGSEVFFQPLLGALPSWIEPVVINYPSSGPSTYEDLLPIAIQAVSHIPRFFILGWSFGGPLALMLAAERSERVCGLLLCATFVHDPRPELKRWIFMINRFVIALVRLQRRLRLRIYGYPSEAFRKAKEETWRRIKSAALAARAKAALTVDSRPLLAFCNAPIVYMESAQDDVVPRHNVASMLCLSPTMQHVIIDGPHLALFTHPAEAAHEIVNFIQSQISPPHSKDY